MAQASDAEDGGCAVWREATAMECLVCSCNGGGGGGGGGVSVVTREQLLETVW